MLKPWLLSSALINTKAENPSAARASRTDSVSSSFMASMAQASALPGSRPNTLPNCMMIAASRVNNRGTRNHKATLRCVLRRCATRNSINVGTHIASQAGSWPKCVATASRAVAVTSRNWRSLRRIGNQCQGSQTRVPMRGATCWADLCVAKFQCEGQLRGVGNQHPGGESPDAMFVVQMTQCIP